VLFFELVVESFVTTRHDLSQNWQSLDDVTLVSDDDSLGDVVLAGVAVVCLLVLVVAEFAWCNGLSVAVRNKFINIEGNIQFLRPELEQLSLPSNFALYVEVVADLESVLVFDENVRSVSLCFIAIGSGLSLLSVYSSMFGVLIICGFLPSSICSQR
jgi:hypothetical protein